METWFAQLSVGRIGENQKDVEGVEGPQRAPDSPVKVSRAATGSRPNDTSRAGGGGGPWGITTLRGYSTSRQTLLSGMTQLRGGFGGRSRMLASPTWNSWNAPDEWLQLSGVRQT